PGWRFWRTRSGSATGLGGGGGSATSFLSTADPGDATTWFLAVSAGEVGSGDLAWGLQEVPARKLISASRRQTVVMQMPTSSLHFMRRRVPKGRGAPKPRPLPEPRPRGSTEQHLAGAPVSERKRSQALPLYFKSPRAQVGRFWEASA